MPGPLPPAPASRFRFRFVSRGESAHRLVRCATQSLRRCHPSAPIVVIDANDQPRITAGELPANSALVHLPPGEDPIAAQFGRGTRHHLFYWRHSPPVLEAVEAACPAEIDVHADLDLLFLRPMDLAALVPHLEDGRIAMAIDRSSLEAYQYGEPLAPDAATATFPVAGSRGPLVQGGLLFRNPADDGGLLRHLWHDACRSAESGNLASVPWDDMAFLSNLLGHGGPLWGRLLALGHEWNFISDEARDPGVFGYVAHYGGAPHLTDHLLRRFEDLCPALGGVSGTPLWRREPELVRVGYGRAGLAGALGYDALTATVHDDPRPDLLSLHPPFSATWNIPPGTAAIEYTPTFSDTLSRIAQNHPGLRLLAYLDGELVDDTRVLPGSFDPRRIALAGRECFTLIGVTEQKNHCHFVLVAPAWVPSPRTEPDLSSASAPPQPHPFLRT